jgi:hypothetical protein
MQAKVAAPPSWVLPPLDPVVPVLPAAELPPLPELDDPPLPPSPLEPALLLLLEVPPAPPAAELPPFVLLEEPDVPADDPASLLDDEPAAPLEADPFRPPEAPAVPPVSVLSEPLRVQATSNRQKRRDLLSDRMPTLWHTGVAPADRRRVSCLGYPCISSSSLPLVSCTHLRMKKIEMMANAVYTP